MIFHKKTLIIGAGVLALALVAGVGTLAAAVTQGNGSDGALYLYDTNGAYVPASQSFAWSDDALGSSSASNLNAVIVCPNASTGVSLFLSAPGSERTVGSWKASAANAFKSGTKTVLTPNLAPVDLINGTPGQAAVKSAGGSYSLGVACTTNNGVTVVGAFFRSITVSATSGVYTAADVDPVATSAPTATATGSPTQTGSVTMAPTTASAVNGVLSLSVPSGAAATFNTPSLVNNKSTTTGALGTVTVSDGRVVSRNGWSLTANVAVFTNSADSTNTIGNAQLGMVPAIVSTEATGITAAAAQVAGSATYPATFATGAAANNVGNTVLNAGLTFVAPQNKGAGTYTSTVTLTVVSQ